MLGIFFTIFGKDSLLVSYAGEFQMFPPVRSPPSDGLVPECHIRAFFLIEKWLCYLFSLVKLLLETRLLDRLGFRGKCAATIA